MREYILTLPGSHLLATENEPLDKGLPDEYSWKLDLYELQQNILRGALVDDAWQ